MTDPLSNEQVGPRTARARDAFEKHFHRVPATEIGDGWFGDSRWIAGYVAALEDLPDEMLSALSQSHD
jgi:hypothetical protein